MLILLFVDSAVFGVFSVRGLYFLNEGKEGWKRGWEGGGCVWHFWGGLVLNALLCLGCLICLNEWEGGRDGACLIRVEYELGV